MSRLPIRPSLNMMRPALHALPSRSSPLPQRLLSASCCCSLLLSLLASTSCTVLKYPRSWPDAPPIPMAGDTAPVPGKGMAKPHPPARTREPNKPEPVEPRPTSAREVEAVLEAARRLVGTRGPLLVEDRQFPYDCSGYVCAVFYQVGEELMILEEGLPLAGMSGTEIIFRRLASANRIFSRDPQPGDLVFFDDTWDRNGDGELNDPFSHIAVVEESFSDGTVVMLHLGNAGIGRLRMNLDRPTEYKDERTGEVLNDKLRRLTRKDPDATPYLTGQLFRAFGRPELNP